MSLAILLRYTFNQLLEGTSFAEVYDNLNINDLLDDDEQAELIVMLKEKAASQGLIISDEHLRPRTVLESFLNVNAELLTATVGAGAQVTLEADGVVMLIHLSDIPELIIKQVVPAKVSSFLAYVYFTNIGGVV
ncbi:MAG TPA: hypothetical protein VJY57_10110 [Thiopseudomonas sp.]|nr:hypothetical protein [Thiopseudomonas sp.]